MRKNVIRSAFLVAVFLGSLSAAAEALNVGDIVVAQDGATNEISKVNPVSGEVTLICTTSLYGITDLAVGPSNLIYIVGYFWDGAAGPTTEALVEMDAVTCQETTVLSDAENVPYTSLTGVAVEADGNIVVSCSGCGPDGKLQVRRIDPSNGAQSVVTEDDVITGSLRGIDVGPNGDIYVVASTGPAFLPGVVRIDPRSGNQTRVTFSPGGDNDEIISPKDLVVGSDGRIFVYDVRFRGSGLERELRIIEVDPINGVQTMRNDSGKGTDTGFSDYRGIGISNSGREIYFVDFSVSPGGQEGISKIDLDSTPATDGNFFRVRVNASGTKLSFPGSGLDVVTVPGAASTDVLGSNTYCDTGSCAAGEGDCDNDNQCQAGLVCVDNVGASYGFRSIVDVCEAPATADVLGSNTYCDTGSCAAGEGDCDNDNQCQAGLVCVDNVGANYGFRSIVDVCEAPATADVLGSNTYCDTGSCAAGEGDCDNDNQCQAGLVCIDNVGANYGFRSIVDVCEAPATADVLGSNTYCDTGSCAAGEGDCDNDNQCQAGLVCVDNVGANYGFRSIVDVCEAPSPVTTPEPNALGGNNYCNGDLCAAGEGDCDNDNQCQAELVCVDDVGANYGFRSIVDVCEAPVPNSSGWIAGQFEPDSNFEAQCVSPRSSINPDTGLQYPDSQGSTLDENNWLRSMSNDLYLWYDEITDLDPADYSTPDYFDLLRTFETTPSGNPKDKPSTHFSFDTEAWQALSQSGVSAGYGATFAIIEGFPPRQIVVSITEPDSPATTAPANLARGAELLEIDGVDVIFGSDVDTLNAGLFPAGLGESHDFTVQDLGSSSSRSFTMVSASITSVPVQNVGTIGTSSGTVGYMLFNDHIATSEQLLIDAVNELQVANISDLVLDLRYNGGGFGDIAGELAYMIAGPGPTAGQTFLEVQFNDKHTVFDPVTGQLLTPTPFHDTALGFSAVAGQALPSLDLPRVYVLTGPGTCSASELIINSLRGVDVEVIQIGSTTCGKPYGFYPLDNCDTTYFTIQFRGTNAKGFGDYTDGFSPSNTNPIEGTAVPGCAVADDFTHALGDPDEGRLAAALAYRMTETCPAASGFSQRRLSRSAEDLWALDGRVFKPPWLENWIMRRKRQ